jgi:hypothetical protein
MVWSCYAVKKELQFISGLLALDLPNHGDIDGDIES